MHCLTYGAYPLRQLDNFVYESTATDAELKMIDFGLARLLRSSQDKMHTMCGTISYIAPEVLDENNTKGYTSACDVWSLGVAAYLLLVGQLPFQHADREEQIRLIQRGIPVFDDKRWKKVSPLAIQFVRSLLNRDPKLRPTAEDALNFPWMKLARDYERAALNQGNSPKATLARNVEVFRSLQAFSRLNQIQRVVLELLAFAAPSQDMVELRQIFVALDETGNGTISRKEFKRAMAAHPEFKKSEVTRIFDSIDFDGRGELSYNKFLAATIGTSTKGVDEQALRKVFHLLDTDNDDIVTHADLQRSLGNAISDGEIDAMLLKIGCTSKKLYFGDLLRLMTGKEKNGRWTRRASLGRSAGAIPAVGELEQGTGSFNSSSFNKSKVRRSFTLGAIEGDLVTNANEAASNGPDVVRPKWLARMRSIEKLHDEVLVRRSSRS